MKRYSAIRSCNVSNRLIAAAKTGMSATYAYDPAGRRMSKTVTGGSYAGTTFFLDAGDDEVAEYDVSGALLRRYVPGRGVDQPIAMVTAAGAKSFFHQDKTGSVIAMSDTSGNIATNNGVADGPYTYDAYGNCLIGGAACSGGVPFKYTGRRYDPETGLYFNRARFYSAAIGAGFGAQTAMTMDLSDALRNQIAQCWSPPVGAPNINQLIVSFELFLNPDGSVSEPPRLATNSASAVANDPYALAAAEAARRAIYTCAPYRMPVNRYSQWRDITLIFDPRMMAGHVPS